MSTSHTNLTFFDNESKGMTLQSIPRVEKSLSNRRKGYFYPLPNHSDSSFIEQKSTILLGTSYLQAMFKNQKYLILLSPLGYDHVLN